MEFFFPSVSGETEQFLEKQKKIKSFEFLIFWQSVKSNKKKFNVS